MSVRGYMHVCVRENEGGSVCACAYVCLHDTYLSDVYISGDYFFELDERSVRPGYPKRIKDVWGISGPIDAAFTRINCQGKTYLFKVHF